MWPPYKYWERQMPTWIGKNPCVIVMALPVVSALLLGLLLDPQLIPKEALPTQSGYLRVHGNSGARMYYAYYEAIAPSRQDLSDTPILLWLQGGPGCSSMMGNFYELGPWKIGEDGKLHKNPTPWNRLFGLLFVDNPVGTGFSIATSAQDIPADEEAVGRDVYAALQHFFRRNPTFRARPFYVTGESYAGKYVPSLALRIITHPNPPRIRLDGLAIGNGLTHPVVQVQSHASVAHSMGLIDSPQRLRLEELQQRAVELVRQEKWRAAANARRRALRWLRRVTGLATLEDVRRNGPYHTTPNGTEYLAPFLNRPSVKEALKAELNITWRVCSPVVRRRMAADIMQSTKRKVEALVRRVPVLLYTGQFDLQDGVLSTEDWIRTLAWSGLRDFLASPREIWRVDNQVAGYVRSHSNLTHVVVRGAGHLVPADQGLHSQIMIESWVRGTPF